MREPFKARLAAGEPVVGTLAFLSSPDVIEVLALAGFDYVIIDLEHTSTNPETVVHMVRAAQLHGMAPLIRVRENSEKLILQALDMGAEGIVVPFIQTPGDVNRAARAMRYAPEGVRGTCTTSRASRYGTLKRNFLEFTRKMNDQLILIALIEDMNGADAIQAIVNCDPGVDVVLIGRSDLSASIGQIGQNNHPAVMNATMSIIEVAKSSSRHVQAGIVMGAEEDAKNWLTAGCRFIAYGTDTGLLLNAAVRAKGQFISAAESFAGPSHNVRT